MKIVESIDSDDDITNEIFNSYFDCKDNFTSNNDNEYNKELYNCINKPKIKSEVNPSIQSGKPSGNVGNEYQNVHS